MRQIKLAPNFLFFSLRQIKSAPNLENAWLRNIKSAPKLIRIRYIESIKYIISMSRIVDHSGFHVFHSKGYQASLGFHSTG